MPLLLLAFFGVYDLMISLIALPASPVDCYFKARIDMTSSMQSYPFVALMDSTATTLNSQCRLKHDSAPWLLMVETVSHYCLFGIAEVPSPALQVENPNLMVAYLFSYVSGRWAHK